ncbi:MAG: YggT family protein [Ktedonobacteraceae bacterium]|nr:YggT family protein [Ktedonobacteraceae bacterium]
MNNRSYPPNPDDPTVQDPRVMYGASQRPNYVGGQQVENRVEYAEDKNLMRANLRYWIATVVYFVLGVLEVIMLLRFVFRLLGANQGSDFVVFLYNLSHVFVYPFNGIFNDQTIGKVSVFEVSTLIAMLVYALVAWGLVALGRVIFAPSLTDGRRVSVSRNSRYMQ